MDLFQFFSLVLGDAEHVGGGGRVVQLQRRCGSFASRCLTVWVVRLTGFRCVTLNNNNKGVLIFNETGWVNPFTAGRHLKQRLKLDTIIK